MKKIFSVIMSLCLCATAFVGMAVNNSNSISENYTLEMSDDNAVSPCSGKDELPGHGGDII